MKLEERSIIKIVIKKMDIQVYYYEFFILHSRAIGKGFGLVSVRNLYMYCIDRVFIQSCTKQLIMMSYMPCCDLFSKYKLSLTGHSCDKTDKYY